MPCAPFVSERRLNASSCTMNSSEIVTIAKVAPRTRRNTIATGIAATATPSPISGTTANGR